MVKAQHEREPHRHLGGGHGQNEQEYYLAIRLGPARPGGDKCEAGRIEHHLNRHECKDHVPACQQSGQPQREQDRRQQECVHAQIGLHRQIPFLPGR